MSTWVTLTPSVLAQLAFSEQRHPGPSLLSSHAHTAVVQGIAPRVTLGTQFSPSEHFILFFFFPFFF